MLSWHQMNDGLTWVYPQQNPQWKESIIKEFKIHPVIAQILVSRGFTTFEQIHDYLYAKLPDLHDPFLMAEMQQAVDRVCRAIRDQENILIYGDNDVDGMTGTALIDRIFTRAWRQCFLLCIHSWIIAAKPHR